MKLRRNHKKRSFGGLSIARMVLFVVILLLLMYMIYQGLQSTIISKPKQQGYELLLNYDDYDILRDNLLPSAKGEIIRHDYFTLSYREDHEQAEWVAYPLTEDMLRKKNVDRNDWFIKDDKVTTGTAEYYDYKGSGFTRGHLAPAGDMAHSEASMVQSFYMSNISPQLRAFNNGIWKELEEQTRDWVYHNDKLYIVSGPILKGQISKTISEKKISVPKYFYKVILDKNGSDKKGIGFVIPHGKSEERLQSYAVTIDSVEALTEINFFETMDSDPELKRIESELDLSQWAFSEARYKLRVERWNNQ